MVVNNRVWVIGAAVLVVLILALGYFLGVAPRLAEVEANGAQRVSVEQQNEIYRGALQSLKKDFDDIEVFKAELAELQKGLPAGAHLSDFVGSLRGFEAVSGVSLTNFTSAPAQPFVYSPPIPPAVPEPVAVPTEGDAAAEAPVVEAPAAVVDPDALVQTISSDELVFIGVDLTVTGSQAQVLDFVDALQHGERRYLVSGLSITSEDGVTYTGTIKGYVFVLIDPSKPAFADENVSLEDTPAAETTTP